MGVLLDKMYQGLSDDLRVISLKRKPQRRRLDTQDVVRNERVSKDRSVVERLFGRINELWHAAMKRRTWKVEKYEGGMWIIVALTIYQVKTSSLTEQDEELYRKHLDKLREIAETRILGKRRTQAVHRRRRNRASDAFCEEFENVLDNQHVNED